MKNIFFCIALHFLAFGVHFSYFGVHFLPRTLHFSFFTLHSLSTIFHTWVFLCNFVVEIERKRRSLADAEKLSRLGIAIKRACCSALGSALFDLLVQCVARMKILVFNNLKVAEKAAT